MTLPNIPSARMTLPEPPARMRPGRALSMTVPWVFYEDRRDVYTDSPTIHLEVIPPTACPPFNPASGYTRGWKQPVSRYTVVYVGRNFPLTLPSVSYR